MRTRRRCLILFGFLAGASACGDATVTMLAPGVGAGIYRLDAVTGNGPDAGSFLLLLDGTATRRVQYAGSGTSGEYVAVGTFELSRDSIRFDLRENGGSSQYIWRVQGSRSGDSFTIRYPDPADGSVTETYRRQ
jgi:hypothetical protein